MNISNSLAVTAWDLSLVVTLVMKSKGLKRSAAICVTMTSAKTSQQDIQYVLQDIQYVYKAAKFHLSMGVRRWGLGVVCVHGEVLEFCSTLTAKKNSLNLF